MLNNSNRLTNTMTGTDMVTLNTNPPSLKNTNPENWGFFVNNETNEYFSLYPLMDFNQCFSAYDNIDGANCQTLFPRRLTQREAAIEAVKKIGLPQINEMDMSAFGDMEDEAEMFQCRLDELRKYIK